MDGVTAIDVPHSMIVNLPPTREIANIQAQMQEVTELPFFLDDFPNMSAMEMEMGIRVQRWENLTKDLFQAECRRNRLFVRMVNPVLVERIPESYWVNLKITYWTPNTCKCHLLYLWDRTEGDATYETKTDEMRLPAMLVPGESLDAGGRVHACVHSYRCELHQDSGAFPQEHFEAVVEHNRAAGRAAESERLRVRTQVLYSLTDFERKFWMAIGQPDEYLQAKQRQLLKVMT